MNINERIQEACAAAQLSQRTLAERTGISQPTLSRIFNGTRVPKMPELILIADATGYTLAQLTGTSLDDHLQYAARATGGADMKALKSTLSWYLELAAYLDDQAIPRGL